LMAARITKLFVVGLRLAALLETLKS